MFPTANPPPLKRPRLETGNHEGGDGRNNRDDNEDDDKRKGRSHHGNHVKMEGSSAVCAEGMYDQICHLNHDQQNHQHNQQDQDCPINTSIPTSNCQTTSTSSATNTGTDSYYDSNSDSSCDTDTSIDTAKKIEYKRQLRVKQEQHEQNLRARSAANQANSESTDNSTSTCQNTSSEQNIGVVNHGMENRPSLAPMTTEGITQNLMMDNANAVMTDRSTTGNTTKTTRITSQQIQEYSTITHDPGMQNSSTAVVSSTSASTSTAIESSESTKRVFYSHDDIHRMQNEILQSASELNITNFDYSNDYYDVNDQSQVAPSSHIQEEATASHTLDTNERDVIDNNGVTKKVKVDGSYEIDNKNQTSSSSTNVNSGFTTAIATTDSSTSSNSEEKEEEANSSHSNQPAKIYFKLDKYKITVTGIIKDIKVCVEEKNVHVPIHIIDEKENKMDDKECDHVNDSRNDSEKKSMEDKGYSFGNTYNSEQPNKNDFQTNEMDDDSDDKDSVIEEAKQNLRKERDHSVSLLSQGDNHHTINASPAFCCKICLCSKKTKERSGQVCNVPCRYYD